MKKILMIFAILMASVNYVLAQSYTGSYTGTMDEIQMNDKTYNPQTGQSFTLSSTYITGTVSKIGSMPGTIYITMPVSVDSAGTITATKGQSCGTLKVLGLIGIDLTLTSLSDATVDTTTKTLEFTLECTGTYLGTTYNAHIHFNGTKSN